MTPRSHQYGYTLVEIVVVIGIIGLFVSIGLISFGEYREAARDVKRQATVEELVKTFRTYQAVTGSLPDCTHGFVIEKVGGTADFRVYPPGPNSNCNATDLAAIESFFNNNFPSDIVDPLGADNMEHIYFYDSVHSCGGGFPAIPMIFAKLEEAENSNHEDVCPQTGTNNDGGYVETNGVPTYPYVKGLD